MVFSFRSVTEFVTCAIVLVFLLSSFSFTSTDAYYPLDSNGNILIKWDVISWTPDGYVAVFTSSTSSYIVTFRPRDDH